MVLSIISVFQFSRLVVVVLVVAMVVVGKLDELTNLDKINI
jgi:hypothetical protein